MNVVKQHYIIDFSSDNNFMQISAMQGDGYEVRYAEIEMIENGQPYVVEPSEVDVCIMGTKPDTKEIWNSCTITQEGYILVEITQQMTAVLGRGEYSIVISHKSQNRQIKSFPFNIITTKAPYDPSYIESTDEFQRLLAAIDDASSGRVATINNIGDVKVTDPQNNQVLKFNSTSHKWENQTDESGGGGSTVTITPVLSSGTKIANYNINGTNGSLYAPSNGGSGGSTVSISPSLSSGTKIADYTIDGATGSLYAPSGGGGSISTPVSIANGGTGATTASEARSNLELGALATKSTASLASDVSGTLPIANGGTGATTASGARSNLGLSSLATLSTVPIGNGGTGNTVGYIRTGQKSGTTIGVKTTAEGYNTTASGDYSHAEGRETIITADYGHVEGYQSSVSQYSSHAEGHITTASGEASHAEGCRTTASGEKSHAEGNETTASGPYSHAEGSLSVASGWCSHAEGGGGCTASGDDSHAEGLKTIAGYACNHAQGHYNKDMESGSTAGTDGNAMVIGNGGVYAQSNAFRVTFAGQVYGLSAFNSSGADYAEFFEWKDGNNNTEDRVGYFVTLDGEKIKIANKGDYILGVISGQPSVIGNGDEDWLGRWQRDDFGRFIWGDIETENSEGEKETIHTILSNPDYDSTQKYIERKDRKEWDYVGMLGNIAVRDDGTCEVNGFCTVADGGVATKAKTGYRVIKRVSNNVIKIILK